MAKPDTILNDIFANTDIVNYCRAISAVDIYIKCFIFISVSGKSPVYECCYSTWIKKYLMIQST